MDWGRIGMGLATGGLSEGVHYLNGANRANKAEAGPYGGIDRSNYNVPGYDAAYGQYGQMAGGFAGRNAPQAGASMFRGQQAGLGQQLAREAGGNGIGQGLIRGQAQGQADRGLQQQYGMAAGARPGQAGLAYRQAAMNAGAQNAQVGGQSAQALGQYQLGAMNNYGQFLQGARGQDDSQAQFNVDARLRQLGLNDQSQLEALRQRLQLQGMQQQGGMGYEANRAGRYGGLLGVPTSEEQLISGAASLGPMLMGA